MGANPSNEGIDALWAPWGDPARGPAPEIHETLWAAAPEAAVPPPGAPWSALQSIARCFGPLPHFAQMCRRP